MSGLSKGGWWAADVHGCGGFQAQDGKSSASISSDCIIE